jgi:hypothetical protein
MGIYINFPFHDTTENDFCILYSILCLSILFYSKLSLVVYNERVHRSRNSMPCLMRWQFGCRLVHGVGRELLINPFYSIL